MDKKKEEGRIYMMLNYLKLDVKTYPCQKPTTCSRSIVFFHIKNWQLVIS